MSYEDFSDFQAVDRFSSAIDAESMNIHAEYLREQILKSVSEKLDVLSGVNSFALESFAREQFLKYNTPEVVIPTARAWFVPVSKSETQNDFGIIELFVYRPYNVDALRSPDGSYDLAFFKLVAGEGEVMVAITPTQIVRFADGEELLFDKTIQGTVITGVKIDEENIDTELGSSNVAHDILLLQGIQKCLETFKPTSQDRLGNGGEDGSRSAA